MFLALDFWKTEHRGWRSMRVEKHEGCKAWGLKSMRVVKHQGVPAWNVIDMCKQCDVIIIIRAHMHTFRYYIQTQHLTALIITFFHSSLTIHFFFLHLSPIKFLKQKRPKDWDSRKEKASWEEEEMKQMKTRKTSQNWMRKRKAMKKSMSLKRTQRLWMLKMRMSSMKPKHLPARWTNGWALKQMQNQNQWMQQKHRTRKSAERGALNQLHHQGLWEPLDQLHQAHQLPARWASKAIWWAFLRLPKACWRMSLQMSHLCHHGERPWE